MKIRKGALLKFLKKERLDSSMMIGFYGGGNYGDELLMEVLAGLLKKQDAKHVSIAYQTPLLYDKFHHDFGFDRIDMYNHVAVIKGMLTHKHLIVGGGGLWGMDANRNILLLSMMLLFCKLFLRKKIYLLAVGYYDSANRFGRLGAWCAAKSATLILARDDESFANFKRLQKNTEHDTDIAYYIDQLDLDDYQKDLELLEKELNVSDKTLFITTRRFRGALAYQLERLVLQCLDNNKDKNIILALMEPRHVDPEGYRRLLQWQRTYPKLQVIDCGFNPLALFLFFRKYRDKLVYIGPQFHGILSAHLNGMPFFPVVYDNKVMGLIKSIAPKLQPVQLTALQPADLQQFIDASYKKS